MWRCGFPGAVSSQDGVHVAWDNCPSQERYLYTGKEGYPSLVWNVNVTHNRKIINMHGPFAGGRNDKTTVRDDTFIEMLREAPEYAGAIWEAMCSLDGSTNTQTGLHCINDGGYHRWMCTMGAEKPDCAGTMELAPVGGSSP
mmetsp:Transcript_17780/g.49766  ORF Transcript_17780/g.49766 Transcript_17780/m.49766 type:complete len:142 (+) Transcript_17780:154-579(+)